jgi:hypothetical protein
MKILEAQDKMQLNVMAEEETSIGNGFTQKKSSISPVSSMTHNVNLPSQHTRVSSNKNQTNKKGF